MIFRSVVGKLWITIIAIVSVLFLILSIFILQYFETYYYSVESNSLSKLGIEVSSIIKTNSDINKAIEVIEDVIAADETKMIIIDSVDDLSELDIQFSDEDISEILGNYREVVQISDESLKIIL